MKWKEKGYRLALQVTNKDSIAKDYADLLLVKNFTGVSNAYNDLEKEIRGDYDCVIACCDECYPSSNQTATDVIKIYYSYFPNGFGILSPEGDHYGSKWSILTPIAGKKWCEQFGIFPSGYYIGYLDVELYYIVNDYKVIKDNKLVNNDKVRYDKTISIYHDHWSRKKGRRNPNYDKSKDFELLKTRVKEHGVEQLLYY